MKTNQEEKSLSWLPENPQPQGKNTKTSTKTFKLGAIFIGFVLICFESSVFLSRIYVVKADAPVPAAALALEPAKPAPENFKFNPNTVSARDLQRLGFSPRQAESICAYREKGGKFYRKADFAKSYVVADSVYKRLEPYIDIPLVDINAADSAAFDALPGIGPYYAAKMVEYRTQLGGKYSSTEQLMDLWRFDREKYDRIRDLICCRNAVKLDLISVSEDSLAHHPAIRSRAAAHGIVLYRRTHSETTPAALYAAGVIDSVQFVKLARTQ